MSESVRLAKRLATEQSCSRGDAERYIEGGWVAVDGKTVEEPGFRVAPGQTVSLLPVSYTHLTLPTTPYV